MFWLKKFLEHFILPIPLTCVIIAIGVTLLWLSRRQKLARIITTIGVLLLLVFSTRIVSEAILRPLEYSYPPLLAAVATPGPNASSVSSASGSAAAPPGSSEMGHPTIPAELQSIKWIVVLGGGSSYAPGLPITSQLSDASLTRLTEALRLHRLLPGAKLVFSGRGNSPRTEAETMAASAVALGLSEHDFVLDNDSRDTEEQAQMIPGLVKGEPFILVTSAAHMVRAMALCHKRGLQPTPAPAGYYSAPTFHFRWEDLIPSKGGVEQSDTAIYEYLGFAWERLRGKA